MPGRTPLEQQQNAELKFSASNKEEDSKTPAAERHRFTQRRSCQLWCNRFWCPISLSGQAVLRCAPCIYTGSIKAVVLLYSRLFRLLLTLHGVRSGIDEPWHLSVSSYRKSLISVVKKSGRNGAEDLNVSAKRLTWRKKKIYSMGEQPDDISTSSKLSSSQLKQYHKVKTKFDVHFVVRRNVIFQRAKFNRRRQEDGETVDTFITALHALAEHCDYGTLKDEMIRDRIVVGLQDSKLSEKLQLDPELSLAKAINHVWQSEAVKEATSPSKKRLQGFWRCKEKCRRGQGNTKEPSETQGWKWAET